MTEILWLWITVGICGVLLFITSKQADKNSERLDRIEWYLSQSGTPEDEENTKQ